MTAIEKIALILVILSLVKLLFLFTMPKAWYGFWGWLWKAQGLFNIFGLVLGGIVLKYLLVKFTIVDIFAVMAFFAPVMWITMAPYRKELFEMASRNSSPGHVWKKNWLGVIVWIALVAWALKELFA